MSFSTNDGNDTATVWQTQRELWDVILKIVLWSIWKMYILILLKEKVEGLMETEGLAPCATLKSDSTEKNIPWGESAWGRARTVADRKTGFQYRLEKA